MSRFQSTVEGYNFLLLQYGVQPMGREKKHPCGDRTFFSVAHVSSIYILKCTTKFLARSSIKDMDYMAGAITTI